MAQVVRGRGVGSRFQCITSETINTASAMSPGGGYSSVGLRVGDLRQGFLTYKGTRATDWPLGVSVQ